MRIAALLLPALLASAPAGAQQLAQYTQYVFNHFSVNPAVAGSKDCLDVRLGYRQQWVGLEGAPRNGWASLHGTLGRKKNGPNRNRHGIGFFAESDNAGNWGYTRLVLAYAYHMQMARDYHLSFGFFGGAQQMKYDVGASTVVDYSDPALDSRATALVVPEVTPGIWAYNKVAWAGLSMHQALGNRISGIGTDSRLARQFMLSGGYKYRIGRRTALIPSLLLKKSKAAPWALDINGMVEWNRKFALGAGYRAGDAVSVLMKVSFAKYFQLGYSYDITTSRLRVGSSNTHEIILGITPCGQEDMSRRMINCPAFD